MGSPSFLNAHHYRYRVREAVKLAGLKSSLGSPLSSQPVTPGSKFRVLTDTGRILTVELSGSGKRVYYSITHENGEPNYSPKRKVLEKGWPKAAAEGRIFTAWVIFVSTLVKFQFSIPPMKLSKKDRRHLQSILDNLNRGLNFIMANDTALMRQHRMSSCDFFASDYAPYAGQKWAPINKQMGSEFVLALTARNQLESLLAEPKIG